MNFNAVNVAMFGIGAILLYCAVKDKTPKEVIANAFATKAAAPKKTPNRPDPTSANAAEHAAGSFIAPPIYPSN